MAARLKDLKIAPQGIRAYVQQYFSVERMAREYAQLYSAALEGEAAVGKSAIDEFATESPEGDPGATRVVA
jgi:hypothetical protein